LERRGLLRPRLADAAAQNPSRPRENSTATNSNAAPAASESGHDRSQTLLLPESLDDYVGPENPVRFVDAFVDSLDLASAGFARVQSKEAGHLYVAFEEMVYPVARHSDGAGAYVGGIYPNGTMR
jgi:hypothetical protein